MLDMLGAITLTALAIVCVGALVRAESRGGVPRNRLALLAATWFVTIAALAAAGVFSSESGGPPAIGAAVIAPVIVAAIAFARSPAVRAFALGIPLVALVAIHIGRLLGGYFIALHSAERLPPTFAHTAGWGDILVGVAAVPVAIAVHRRAAGWRPLALAWNGFALLDLAVAVSLGIGSAPGSPLQFIHEGPNPGTMGNLPWLLIPGFLVPLYLISHGAIFAQLAMPRAAERRPDAREWLAGASGGGARTR